VYNEVIRTDKDHSNYSMTETAIQLKFQVSELGSH